MAKTAGTNQAVILLTRSCTGNRAFCAFCTISMIWLSVVSAPMARASKVKLPFSLSVPALTSAPEDLKVGTGSPVSMLSLTQLSPSRTVPSTEIRSPGRTWITSPSTMFSIAISTGSLPRTTVAVAGRSAIKRVIALPVRPFARASIHRPARMRVMITAAASKYTLRAASGSSEGAKSVKVE